MPLCYPLPHTGDRPFCEVYGKNNIYLDFVALIIASETLHKPCEKIFSSNPIPPKLLHFQNNAVYL